MPLRLVPTQTCGSNPGLQQSHNRCHSPYCVAYKPNTAFYECHGAEGWQALADTVAYIRKNYPRPVRYCRRKNAAT